MMLAVALAIAMKPTTRLAENKPPVNLELMIPRAFADWKLDRSLAPIIASPDVQERLALIYNQTLSRTYVNLAGQHVMLSIAYGDNQATDDTQVHRPEFCYSAQGFRLENGKDDILQFQQTSFPVRKLVAINGNRTEPITYWITVGDRATLPGMGRKWAQLTYGLTGKVPDGLLFRISSINSNIADAYQLQMEFVNALLDSIPLSSRERLVGQLQ